MTLIHGILGLAALAAGLRLNARMIRRRWFADQTPSRLEGARGRLIGELGLAALAGYLAGRRRDRRDLEREARFAELSDRYEPLHDQKDW